KDTTETVDQALLEIYERLRPGEPPTVGNARNLLYSRFFDPKRYDLANVGRYKMNKKLHLKNRLFNQVLAEPIVDKETGEIVADAGTTIDRRTLGNIIDVLEESANLETYHPENGLPDDPVEIQSISVEAPNPDEGTRISNGLAFPHVEVKSITRSDI